MPLNMKNINNFISRCEVRTRDHAPKAPRAVWTQSWRSTRSAVDIFNTLRAFTKEPIREQEIKLECMNWYRHIYIYCSEVRVKLTDHDFLFLLGDNINHRLGYWPSILNEVYTPHY